jgi:hypothetical protein
VSPPPPAPVACEIARRRLVAYLHFSSLTLTIRPVEGRWPHIGAVMLYMARRGYVTHQNLPRANPCTAIEKDSRQRQAPRLMGLHYLPATILPSSESNRILLQLQNRICKDRRALSNDQLQMNLSTGSVMNPSQLGRMRCTAVATSVVRPTLIVHPITSIKRTSLLARIESRRILVQR